MLGFKRPAVVALIAAGVAAGIACGDTDTEPPATAVTSEAGADVVTPPAPDAQADTTTPLPPGCEKVPSLMASAASAIEQQYKDTGATGSSIAVWCGGVISSLATGTVKAGGDPMKETTRFQLASITKTFTALTVLSLAAEGTVDLDAPITTYVPFIKGDFQGTPFALKHLLSHTAGYPVDFIDGNYDDDSLEGIFQNNATQSPWSPAGEVFNYSNLGFALAGLAIQKKTGTPFGPLVEQRAFAKLGMTRATMTAKTVADEGDFAYGNVPGEAPLGPHDAYYETGNYGPMGGAWSSAIDLAKFGVALAKKDTAVMPAASWDAMTTVRTKTTFATKYGYGLIIEPGAHPVFSHDGSVPGFTTQMMFIPDLGLGVAILINGDSADAFTSSTDIIKGLTDARPDPPPVVGTENDWMGAYYDPINLGMITISKNGAAWVGHWKGVDHPLTQSGEEQLSYNTQLGPAPIDFWRDDATGKVTWALTTEGHAKRVEIQDGGVDGAADAADAGHD